MAFTYDRYKNPLLYTLVIVLFFASIGLTKLLHDKADGLYALSSYKFKVRDRHVLSQASAKIISFGFDNLLADYYWLSAIQDYSGWDYQSPFMYEYFRNISAIDPKFEYPYLFEIFALASNKIPNSMDTISANADRGIAALPNNWDIPFYLATKWRTFGKNDEKAQQYLKIAAENPEAPPVVGIFYSAFTANKLLGREASIAMLSVVRDTTDSALIKRIAARGIATETVRNVLENGVIAYKATYGVYPKSLSDLISNHFVTLPKSLTDIMILEVNQKTGAIRIIEKAN